MKLGSVSIPAGPFLIIDKRTVSILAGTIDKKHNKFKLYNSIGALPSAWTLMPMGYFLDNKFSQLMYQLKHVILRIFVLTPFFFSSGIFKN